MSLQVPNHHEHWPADETNAPFDDADDMTHDNPDELEDGMSNTGELPYSHPNSSTCCHSLQYFDTRLRIQCSNSGKTRVSSR